MLSLYRAVGGAARRSRESGDPEATKGRKAGLMLILSRVGGATDGLPLRPLPPVAAVRWFPVQRRAAAGRVRSGLRSPDAESRASAEVGLHGFLSCAPDVRFVDRPHG